MLMPFYHKACTTDPFDKSLKNQKFFSIKTLLCGTMESLLTDFSYLLIR